MSFRKHGSATGPITEVEEPQITRVARLDGDPAWQDEDEYGLAQESGEDPGTEE